MKPAVTVDIAGARSSAVTAAHGITPGELKQVETPVLRAHRALQDDRAQGRHGFYDLYKDQAGLNAVKKAARGFSKVGYENLVVLGIGGSALGIKTLATALKPPYYNLLTRKAREGRPRLFVMDNIDPDSFGGMLGLCPHDKTLYNVISKSGATAETVSQLLIVVEELERTLGGTAMRDHLVVTTGPREKGGALTPLQHVKKEYRLQGFRVPSTVGGRFSVFSPVGMFPAAVLGMDINALAAGCGAMDRRTSKASLRENPAYLRAAVHYLAWSKKGKSLAVMMPYSDRLRDVAEWYRQLWAESLGKKESLDRRNKALYAGQTPVRALGVTDQHSQLQLYLEGPNDKLITLVEERKFSRQVKIPDALPGLGGLEYLEGRTLNRLMASERKATADALRESNRPVVRIGVPWVDAHTMGQLLYMLQVETAMAGRLFNVDAFDQPAVEAIKVFTRKNMGRRQ